MLGSPLISFSGIASSPAAEASDVSDAAEASSVAELSGAAEAEASVGADEPLSAAGASDAVEPEPPQAVMENTIADANAIASTLLFFITFSSLKIIVLFHRP